MEDWLFKKDEYTPKDDGHKFLDKSILSILKIIGRIRRKGVRHDGFSYHVNPTLKMAFTFLILLMVALSRNYIFILIMDVYALINIFILAQEERKNILLISVVIPLFTLVMLIPSMILGNMKNSILLLQKVIASIMLVNWLSYTTKWDHITKSLKLFFIPDLFIWVMEITIKFIVLLGEYSVDLLYALKLRSIGKNDERYDSISKIMGNLFLKSKHMGEEMFSAMECRGFVGEYKTVAKFELTKIDYIYSLLHLCFIGLFLITFLGGMK